MRSHVPHIHELKMTAGGEGARVHRGGVGEGTASRSQDSNYVKRPVGCSAATKWLQKLQSIAFMYRHTGVPRFQFRRPFQASTSLTVEHAIFGHQERGGLYLKYGTERETIRQYSDDAGPGRET